MQLPNSDPVSFGAHQQTSRGVRAEQAASPRSVMFVVWPEYGHVVTPLSLAKQLRAVNYRVTFAGVRNFEQSMRRLGYDYANLSPPREGDKPTLFDFMPNRASFLEALDVFIEVFRAALRAERPSLVLFDSLYSAFGTVASAEGIPWAIYETDLPREYDPIVPPPHLLLAPRPETIELIREEWSAQLFTVGRARAHAENRIDSGHAWATAFFPTLLTHELQARLGTSVSFNEDALYAPVANVPRMVFCPEEFDFERTRREGTSWVGPYVDFSRNEPDFPWASLPADARVAYCSLGTQSARHENSVGVLQAVIDAFRGLDDYFLIVACNARQRAELENLTPRVLVVDKAPQLAVLRRASVALVHGGFNSLKECAALGVPVIALPLGFDQPRNSALVEHRGLGVALDPARLSVEQLVDAVAKVDTDAVRKACAAMKARFEASAAESRALHFVESFFTKNEQARG